MRVDAYFEGHFYYNTFSRSPLVFGAFPSLHIGWPTLLMMFFVYAHDICVSSRFKLFVYCYYAWVCFAVVYPITLLGLPHPLSSRSPLALSPCPLSQSSLSHRPLAPSRHHSPAPLSSYGPLTLRKLLTKNRYLQHHYVIDVLGGAAYALIVFHLFGPHRDAIEPSQRPAVESKRI